MTDDSDLDRDWIPDDETAEERAEREAEERRYKAAVHWNRARIEARDRLVNQFLWTPGGANKFMDLYDKEVPGKNLAFDEYWDGFWQKAGLTRWDG